MRRDGKEDRANITLAYDLIGKEVYVVWQDGRPYVCVRLLAVDVNLRFVKVQHHASVWWMPLRGVSSISEQAGAGCP